MLWYTDKDGRLFNLSRALTIAINHIPFDDEDASITVLFDGSETAEVYRLFDGTREQCEREMLVIHEVLGLD